MKNPYVYVGSSLTSAAKRLITITPEDGVNLETVCKALRIYNPTAGVASVKVRTLGGDTATIKVPAESVWAEPVMIIGVDETGTTPGLELHGYSD